MDVGRDAARSLRGVLRGDSVGVGEFSNLVGVVASFSSASVWPFVEGLESEGMERVELLLKAAALKLSDNLRSLPILILLSICTCRLDPEFTSRTGAVNREGSSAPCG